MATHEIKLKPICEAVFYDGAPIPVGPSNWGTRLILPVLGGNVTGPKLNGKIRPFGADWGLIRVDNCLEIDVRAVIETDDGAFIHTYYPGIIDMTQEQVDEFLAGKLPAGLDIYVAPRFETSHENYQWLTRIQAAGRGSVVEDGDRFKVTYSVYALSV